jgi:hypothetical protein
MSYLLYGKIGSNQTSHKLNGVITWLEENVGRYLSCMSTYWSDNLVKAKEAEWVDTYQAMIRFSESIVPYSILKIIHFTGVGWEAYYGLDRDGIGHTHYFVRVHDDVKAVQLKLELFSE